MILNEASNNALITAKQGILSILRVQHLPMNQVQNTITKTHLILGIH
uniref:Uncharacterized protein n=1 Tax=Rhizophora mucronata TaxID=61149 RepID=A0A2P2QPJ2_RHIMU